MHNVHERSEVVSGTTRCVTRRLEHVSGGLNHTFLHLCESGRRDRGFKAALRLRGKYLEYGTVIEREVWHA
eukprot:6398530-Amphidinium_carterae.1